jgi:proteasome lid subunit RPN8/RPN11
MRIARDVIEKIIAHAEKDAPVEACGFLIGTKREITGHLPITNAEARIDHFTFEPNEQFAAYQAVARSDFDIIGVYHSHVSTPAEPSAEDIRLARNRNLLHVIVSLIEGGKTVKGFRINEGKVEEEPLPVIENETS